MPGQLSLHSCPVCGGYRRRVESQCQGWRPAWTRAIFRPLFKLCRLAVCHSRPNPEIETLSTRTLAGRASWLGQTKTGKSVREARTTPPTLNMWMYWCLVAFPRYGKTVFPTAHIALISRNYVPSSELYDILGNSKTHRTYDSRPTSVRHVNTARPVARIENNPF